MSVRNGRNLKVDWRGERLMGLFEQASNEQNAERFMLRVAKEGVMANKHRTTNEVPAFSKKGDAVAPNRKLHSDVVTPNQRDRRRLLRR